MAAPALNELDGLLASLNQLKPPGASKGKITAITSLCISNIKAESTIVQSFYRALKKAPATHKLGALYVIDSVVRQWIEKAKTSGQDLQIDGRGEPGTYPAAVKRVTELMPALFEDIIKGIPADQKPKLDNMLTIWERGSTFPAKMLADFKGRLNVGGVSQPRANVPAPPSNAAHEKYSAPIMTRPVFSPLGYPPRQLYDAGFLQGTPVLTASSAPPQQAQSIAAMPPTPNAPGTDVNSILAALSRAAPPAASTSTFPSASQPAASALPAHIPPELAALFSQQLQLPHQHVAPPGAPTPAMPSQQHQPYSWSAPAPPAPPASNQSYQAQPPYNGYPMPPPSVPQAYSVAPPPPQQYQPPVQADPLAPLRGLLPDNILNDQQKLIPALQLLADLQKDGIPPDRWGPVLKAFEEQFQPAAPAYHPHNDPGRNRGRSQSPDRGGRGRASPVYGTYDAEMARRQADEDRNGHGNQGGRNRYRQRSPMRNSPAPTAMNGKPMQPKVINFDPALPPDSIKVLSRTLFVGGANGTQDQIQDLFERFGRVQTCIANRDKRHAFVKMTTRGYALAAKAGMEDMQSHNDREVMNVARQTKWGVGFGPRECCDYARGESIIPIHKLTDADMKWLLTAEFGGTGGRKVEGGMVLEEPDIEIGAGVSSKAMSKRVGPENNAPSSKRHKDGRGERHYKNKGGDHGYGGGYGGGAGGPSPMDAYAYARPEPVAVATPPAVPGFGFSLNLPGNGQNAYR